MKLHIIKILGGLVVAALGYFYLYPSESYQPRYPYLPPGVSAAQLDLHRERNAANAHSRQVEEELREQTRLLQQSNQRELRP